MLMNNKIIFDSNFYAAIKSSDSKKVCYVTYSNQYGYSMIGSDCNFISNVRKIADYITDSAVEDIDIPFILENASFNDGDIVGSITIADTEYYVVKVYAYVHSGTVLSLHPYKDIFDSGLSGIVLMRKAYCPLDYVASYVKDFIHDLEAYLEGNVFDFNIFYTEDQETIIDSISSVCYPSSFTEFLSQFDFICDDSDIYMAYDIVDKIKKTCSYTLEV